MANVPANPPNPALHTTIPEHGKTIPCLLIVRMNNVEDNSLEAFLTDEPPRVADVLVKPYHFYDPLGFRWTKVFPYAIAGIAGADSRGPTGCPHVLWYKPILDIVQKLPSIQLAKSGCRFLMADAIVMALYLYLKDKNDHIYWQCKKKNLAEAAVEIYCGTSHPVWCFRVDICIKYRD